MNGSVDEGEGFTQRPAPRDAMSGAQIQSRSGWPLLSALEGRDE